MQLLKEPPELGLQNVSGRRVCCLPAGHQEEPGTLTLQVGICSPSGTRFIYLSPSRAAPRPSPGQAPAPTVIILKCVVHSQGPPWRVTLLSQSTLAQPQGSSASSFCPASWEPSLPSPPPSLPGEHGELIPSQRQGHRMSQLPYTQAQPCDPCSDKLQGQNCLEVLGRIFLIRSFSSVLESSGQKP